MSRKYEKVQELLPAINGMLEAGYTHREIAAHFGLESKIVVKQLLHRERVREAKAAAGIEPRPKGRPRKDAAPRDIVAEQAYEIKTTRRTRGMCRP